MAVLLGLGESCHLVPRAIALCTTGLQDYTVALGIGKWITSITMTVFYVILYYVWRIRYQVTEHKGLTFAVYIFAIIRIVLCMFPQNEWLSAHAPLSWGIYRNIPFALLGLLVIVLFFQSSQQKNYCFDFCILYSSCLVCRYNSSSRHVNDSKNLCICMDCMDWL